MKQAMSFMFDSAKGLLEASNYLLEHIEDEGVKRNPVKHSFILTAAASLESILNDAIVSFAHRTFHKNDYKRHAKAYLGMSLRGKLDIIGFLMSGGSHITDNCSPEYQKLSILISLRNESAHSKEFFKEFEIEIAFDEMGDETFLLPSELANKFQTPPLASSKQDLKMTYECLEALYKTLSREVKFQDTGIFKAA